MRLKHFIVNTLKVCPLLLALLFSSCKSDSDHTGTGPLTVKTETAYIYSEQDKGDYQFISKPFRTSELSFRVGGPIDRFEVYPGNHYKRGDIIAEIDSRDFRIRKERASALYEQLKAEYERISVLYEKGNVSASTFEKAKADYISAKAAYDESCNALLHNDDGELLSGMSGKAHIVVDENEDTAGKSVAIPLQALCHRPGIGDFVWVVDKNNSTVKMRKVSGTELKADGIALIKEGLKEGEIVATTGLRFLSDGMCVNLNR